MKMLLTSGGIQNKSIKNALVSMLNKPISECHALCITTASFAFKKGSQLAYEFITGKSSTPMCEIGWKSVGLLELSALSHVEKDVWLPQLQAIDVLLVNGGDPLFLNYFMKNSGLSDELPYLDLVYVGLSAGSMIMAPRIGEEFVGWQSPSETDETLGLVDFAIYPHLDHVQLPENTMENAVKWSSNMTCDTYAIDDETAIKVVDDQIEVISEGHWKFFNKK